MSDKLSHLIKLVDSMPEPQAKLLLKKLFQESPLVAFKIISRQFDFVDLKYADEAGIAALFDALPSQLLMLALNGSEDALVRRFTDCMGTNEATEFIETLYASRASDAAIKDARKKVLVKAFLLKKRGALRVSRPGID